MNKKILTGLRLLSTLVLSSCDIYSLLSFDLLSSEEEISSFEEQSSISVTSSEYSSSEIISSSSEISTSEYESSIESITSSSQEETGYYKLDDLTTDNIKVGKLISKEEIKPVFLRVDSELADKSAKK